MRRGRHGSGLLSGLAGVVLAFGVVLGGAPAASAARPAHPLGNFTVSTYDGLTVAPRALSVAHVEDLAEVPAARAVTRIDRNGDARLSRAERARWARAMCARAARKSRAEADGRALRLAATPARARAVERPGEAGLRTLRLECGLRAPLTLARGTVLRFTGTAAVGEPGPGWREITARGDRTTLTRSSVPRRSASARLTRYPDDPLAEPVRVRAATLTARPGGPAAGADGGARDTGLPPSPADGLTERFTGLVGRHELTPGFGVFALALATVLGAAHALAPGHGKTVMAAYAAAARGRRTLRDVLRIGAAVTVTHTAGVVLLGLLVVGGSRAAPFVTPWLGVASGVLVAVAGAFLLRRARRHGRTHRHGHTHTHDHAPPRGHTHPHGHAHSAPLRKRDTLLLGFAGGLVPSPSAVLVLVGSSALGQLWFGALLVTAYGAGLALTLVAVGVLLVHVGGRLAHRLTGTGRYARLLGALHRTAPTGTAVLVVVLGAALAARALVTV
ncbi:hypothetical protein GCM10009801_71210 [Streptomyces albiaxialis]|uniref:Nickel transporter n=1 Tax=Streptomyces albiaxialis TaxID=329523 RepID=A0ABN2WW90_9ACTN